MGWYRAERASWAAIPFTAASAEGTHSSRLGVGSATEGTLWAAAWKRPTRWAMVLKKLAAAIQLASRASSATTCASISRSSEAARVSASSSTRA